MSTILGKDPVEGPAPEKAIAIGAVLAKDALIAAKLANPDGPSMDTTDDSEVTDVETAKRWSKVTLQRSIEGKDILMN